MIDNLADKFKTLSNALDILYVIKGYKPVSRIIVDDTNIEKFKQDIGSLGLDVVFCDFKIEKKTEKDKSYSNIGIRLNPRSPVTGCLFAYVSKDIDKATKAKEAEHMGKHKELGKLLGYPACCIEFFDRFFPIESRRKNDYVFPALHNSRTFDFHNNILLRSMDITLLSHFPCSFGCERSKEIAKKRLGLIKNDKEELYDVFINHLKNVVIYTYNFGVLVLKDSKRINDEITYTDVIATEKNQLYELLKNNKKIKIEKDGFSVDGRVINDENIRLVNFSDG